jgi:hypothetical protein
MKTTTKIVGLFCLMQSMHTIAQGYLNHAQIKTTYSASVLSKINPASIATTYNKEDAIEYMDCKEQLNIALDTFRLKLKAAPTNTDYVKEYNSLHTDSIDLAVFIKKYSVGRQSSCSFNYGLFQSYTGVFDDNPKNITQIRFSYSYPIHHSAGFILKSNETKCVYFRNVHLTGDITPFSSNKNFAVKDTMLNPQYPDSTLSKNKKPYYNNLDLFQFSRLNVYLHLNYLTIMRKYFTGYFNGFLGIGRTWFNSRGDSSYRVNFWMYGASITAKTKFPFFINSVGEVRLFTVNPLTNGAYNTLNPQNSETIRNLNKDVIIANNQKYYASFNITLQAKVSKKADDSYTPSSSSTSSSADAILFARLSFNTMLNSMWQPKLNYNNFYTLQIGYAGNIENLIKGVRTAAGL